MSLRSCNSLVQVVDVECASDSSHDAVSSSEGSECTGATVAVPWYLHGAVKNSVKLSDEIPVFASFMSLTEDEANQRNTVRHMVQQTVSQLCPSATVKCCGSFSWGTAQGGSELDLVVEDLPMPCTPRLKALLTSLGMTVRGACSELFQAVVNDLVVNIAVVAGPSEARATTNVVRRWMHEAPELTDLCIVVEALLGQVRCNVVSNGGLSSFAILCLAMHALRTAPARDAGTLLVHFLRYYGETFDFAVHSVSPCGAAVPKIHHGEQISIVHPLNTAVNVSAGCKRLPQIRAHFQYCLIALSKWDASSQGYK
eukprot:Sspe_Gene.53979::Locus_29815_Transcript_1_1_Confidence_1.000_Length_997::g.53979::m.53979/K03514/PAPD5_7, TRF4; non-canonical poly(A) RNA polymerase PAPD5/7